MFDQNIYNLTTSGEERSLEKCLDFCLQKVLDLNTDATTY